jgi:oxygen-independent coproporphyrinogen-3 oxidase
LHSRADRPHGERLAYSERIAKEIEDFLQSSKTAPLSTVYFGGGTPALCELSKIFDTIGRHEKTDGFEFTVELNPLDADPSLLDRLKKGGVNRVSMGVQSFDEATLKEMGRAHDKTRAEEAWKMIRDAGFDNAGIDLICGWPGSGWNRTLESAVALKPDHCSVYTLILEPGTRLAREVELGRVTLPCDDVALAELAAAESALGSIGLERYEISNFAKPGKECRHNLATWRGEDYIGIGDGACSREGNAVSRVIFRLRLLKEGFSPEKAAADFPELASRVEEWKETLERFVAEDLLQVSRPADRRASYLLTSRGAEVCDAILAELV